MKPVSIMVTMGPCSIYGVFYRQAITEINLYTISTTGTRNSGHNKEVAAFNNEHYIDKISLHVSQ